MDTKDKIKFYIAQVESIISDIDQNADRDSISTRYSDLKSNIQNEIKSFNYEDATTYEESTFSPALYDFLTRLKAKRGCKNSKTIQSSLIDAIGILEWYENSKPKQNKGIN